MSQATLEEYLSRVQTARKSALELIALGRLDEAKSKYLGRKGQFRQLQDLLGRLPSEMRPVYGKAFNEARGEVERAFESAVAAKSSTLAVGPAFDFLPGVQPPIGARHPLIQTIDEIVEIFRSMGFALAHGPEVEDVFHNFIALNIPEDHPARDPRDNFYITDDVLLRSQTSTIQIRVMEQQPPPVRVIAIGRVYRPDPLDATHSPMFHQVEGLWVEEGVTLADLKTVLRMFTRAYLGPEVKIRFRPSFFPFTEPSIEVDMTWDQGDQSWIELGGAGMVDPNVLDAVGYDSERLTGFAFGLGVDRLTMRRHAIDHMKLLFENDVRFLRQFA
jgi:phenylalanyl-tRNA synthetase alpha chain